MTNSELFIHKMRQFKTRENCAVVEGIIKGFKAIHESAGTIAKPVMEGPGAGYGIRISNAEVNSASIEGNVLTLEINASWQAAGYDWRAVGVDDMTVRITDEAGELAGVDAASIKNFAVDGKLLASCGSVFCCPEDGVFTWGGKYDRMRFNYESEGYINDEGPFDGLVTVGDYSAFGETQNCTLEIICQPMADEIRFEHDNPYEDDEPETTPEALPEAAEAPAQNASSDQDKAIAMLKKYQSEMGLDRKSFAKVMQNTIAKVNTDETKKKAMLAGLKAYLAS